MGAFIMFMSAAYTKKIFNTLKDTQLKSSWKKLRILMFLFLAGYLAVVLMVILGKTELLALFSGIIFFMGSLFVFLVVHTGLDSFTKLNTLNQNLDDTEIKNKELVQFAYITSHDLKTPLRGISSLASFIELDLKSGETEQVYQHIEILQQQVERLENLINGILHYSMIGKITIQPINLNKLLTEEFKNYQNLKNVIISKNDNLPIINGDKTQLSQVFSNLIGNAIKYNDKELCKINISITEGKKFYKIVIEDNGPGIPKEFHEKIFEVFQTLQEQDSNDSTGIGLSIVQKIIKKHQGSIRVASNGQLGTKFIISYPKELNLQA